MGCGSSTAAGCVDDKLTALSPLSIRTMSGGSCFTSEALSENDTPTTMASTVCDDDIIVEAEEIKAQDSVSTPSLVFTKSKVHGQPSSFKLAPLRGHRKAVACTALMCDGKVAFSADASTDEGLVRLTLTSTRELVGTLGGALKPRENQGVRSAVKGIAASPCGQVVVTCHSNGLAIVWDSLSHKVIGEFTIPEGDRPLVTILQDQRIAVTQRGHRTITLFSMHSSSVNTLDIPSPVTSLTSFRKSLAAGCKDGTVCIWNLSSTIPSRIDASAGDQPVMSLSFACELFLISADPTSLCAWDLSTGEVSWSYTPEMKLSGVMCTVSAGPSSPYHYALAGFSSEGAAVVRVSTGEVVDYLSTKFPLTSMSTANVMGKAVCGDASGNLFCFTMA